MNKTVPLTVEEALNYLSLWWSLSFKSSQFLFDMWLLGPKSNLSLREPIYLSNTTNLHFHASAILLAIITPSNVMNIQMKTILVFHLPQS